MNAWAEKMGYYAADKISKFGTYDKSHRMVLQCYVELQDTNDEDAEYRIEMYYLGKGTFVLGRYRLATNLPKG